MKQAGAAAAKAPAWSVFPELAPVEPGEPVGLRNRNLLVAPPREQPAPKSTPDRSPSGSIRVSAVSFANMGQYGDLLPNFLKARKQTFIDRLKWDLPEADGMEFDQYDTPMARWIIVHEFGEILGGTRLTPTTAQCGIYSYMLRDAQKGLLPNIPTDVLFIDAPVDQKTWEASRLFITDNVPAKRRLHVHSLLIKQMSESARDVGAKHVIGIVPALWSRWLRRLKLDAVPVGPKFDIDGTVTQAALFNVNKSRI